MEYGEKITALRKARGMTQADLGRELNVTFQAVSNWERGEAIPDFETLSRIAKIFCVPISYFEDNAYKQNTYNNPYKNDTYGIFTAKPTSPPEMLGVCTTCEKVVYRGTEGQTSPTLICSSCYDRLAAEKQKEINKAQRKKQLMSTNAKRALNKGLIASGIITGILMILSIVLMCLFPPENIWADLVYLVLDVIFNFTFIAQLFWKGTVVHTISIGGKLFNSMFSWGGLIVFLLLGLIIIPILLVITIFFLFIGYLISPFTFIPEVIRLRRASKT